MYLLNNNRQWTEGTKVELNVPTQNSSQSCQRNQTLTIQDY